MKLKEKLNTLKDILPFSLAYRLKNELDIIKWKKKGSPVPPPHIIKINAINKYAIKNNTEILIETGTHHGLTVWTLRKKFKKIYSIELNEKLFTKVKEKFADFNHITIIQGDSGEKLEEVLKKLDKKALFWLDGHYSGGITSKGELETPIKKELEMIFNHHIKDHLLLIDDARLFDGTKDYPTINEIENILKKNTNRYLMEVKDDIIRISPKNSK